MRSRPAPDQPVHASQLIQQIFGLPQFLYPSYVTYAELDGYCYGKSVALEGIVLKIDMNAHIVKHFPPCGMGMTLYRRYKIPRESLSVWVLNT